MSQKGVPAFKNELKTNEEILKKNLARKTCVIPSLFLEDFIMLL